METLTKENTIIENDYESDKTFEKVLTLAIAIGCKLLSCGASVSRVEDSVERICTAYGAIKINVMAIPSMVIGCIKTPDGREFTQMRRVPSQSNNFHMIERFNQLSRDICKNCPPIEQAESMYREINSAPFFKVTTKILGAAIGAGAFTIFFGGTLIDGVIGAIIGALIVFLDIILSLRSFNGYARTFMICFVGGSLSVLLCAALNAIGVPSHNSMVMIGTIMLSIPGLLISNAIRDLFVGDLLTGAFQIINGILATLAIVAGYGLAIALFGAVGPSVETPIREGAVYYIYLFLSCLIGCLGFELYFSLGKKHLFTALLGGISTFTVYEVGYIFTNDLFVSNLIATIYISILAELMARWIKAPATVFLMPGIFPLVPGGLLFYTINSFILGQMSAGSAYGKDAILVFFGIAVGLSLVTAIFRLIAPSRKKNNIKKLEFLKKNIK